MQTFVRIFPPTGWAMGHDPLFWYPIFKILRKTIKVYVPGEGIHIVEFTKKWVRAAKEA